ncbi:MAG: TonB-dependent receptor [Verrucomicrobiota bacterium]|nr:TonB-dependent receptor [Verrucomicrobiota bacterium]MDE2714238.1 TonB-dependent receptor [Verrucomicrobiota bacterium]
MTDPTLTSAQKAQAINFDRGQYGTFAEIGAGQEVARWFFRVGGASGTVAKSMSAYDMAVSDAIYGPSQRYVSEDRLRHMLDHEYGLLDQRLAPERGADTRFFVYANTVAARSFSRQQDGQGWMGIRFQTAPGSPPSDLVLHVRLLDKDNLKQQEAVGIIGVNLIHGAMESHADPERLVGSLLDGLDPRRAEVGLARFSGPDFEGVDNRLMALELVKQGLAKATLFDTSGEVTHPTEALYHKPIVLERGSFRPVTRTTHHMLQSSLAQFTEEPRVKGKDVTVLFEMTLKNLSHEGEIDSRDFLERVDILAAMGEGLGGDHKVMVSNCAEFHKLARYLFRYTKEPVGVTLGVPTLREIFEEKYYADLEGGLLEACGRLFKNDLRLYVYPASAPVGGVLHAKELRLPKHLQGLFDYLVENNFIRGIDDFNPEYLAIRSRDVLKHIQAGDDVWEEMVPPAVAACIRARGLLGCKETLTTQ